MMLLIAPHTMKAKVIPRRKNQPTNQALNVLIKQMIHNNKIFESSKAYLATSPESNDGTKPNTYAPAA